MNQTAYMPEDITIIKGARIDPYQEAVEQVYIDTPSDWQKAIGKDLWYQYGVFNMSEGGTRPSLDEAGRRYFNHQVGQAKDAGIDFALSLPVRRAIDIGCGWGSTLRALSELFPGCPCIDGVNISPQQLVYTQELLAREGLSDRINLYLCNAKDLAGLPDADIPYDLAVLRGSIIHFTQDVFEETMRALASRIRSGGVVLISESLYKGDLKMYRPFIPDENDRSACAHRRTSSDVSNVLEASGFQILDLRISPSNEDVIHWFDVVRHNIETHGLANDKLAFKDLRDVAINWTDALRKDKVAVYSLVARRI